MMQLEPSMGFMLYLLATLGTLLGIWILNHIRTRNWRLSFSENNLFVCEYCHNAYLDKRYKDVTQCPQCASFNKNNLYLKK